MKVSLLPLVLLCVSAGYTDLATAQTTQGDIDFSSELNRLNTVPQDDYRAGSWGSDLEAWKLGNTRIAERKHQEKLEAAKTKCYSYLRDPSRVNKVKCRKPEYVAEVLSHSEVTCDGNLCEPVMKICLQDYKEPNQYYKCMRALAPSSNITVGANGSAEARREKKARRAQKNCRATRDYCAAVLADLQAGKAPNQAIPAWDKQDERDMEAASKIIDQHLKSALDWVSDEKRKRDRAAAEAAAQAKRKAILERKAEAAARAAAQKKESEKWCRAEISKNNYWCGCVEYFEKMPTACLK